jgi:hypothetical protein
MAGRGGIVPGRDPLLARIRDGLRGVMSVRVRVLWRCRLLLSPRSRMRVGRKSRVLEGLGGGRLFDGWGSGVPSGCE